MLAGASPNIKIFFVFPKEIVLLLGKCSTKSLQRVQEAISLSIRDRFSFSFSKRYLFLLWKTSVFHLKPPAVQVRNLKSESVQ